LTATANQNVGGTSGIYDLRIFDETANTVVQSCISGTTCTVSATFSTGGPHTYVAEVSAGARYADPGTTTDIQATSNDVVLSRAAWSVSLTSNESTFAAGSSFTLTATANQNVGNTNGNYYLRIYDLTTGSLISACYSGSVCTGSTTFSDGGPHTYQAEVSKGSLYAGLGTTTDVQATSNDVQVAREAWTVTLTSDLTTFSAGQKVTFTATANQNVGSPSGHYLRIYDTTAGTEVGVCTSGTTCVVSTAFYSGTPHTYQAEVSVGSLYATYGTTSDVFATSNDIVATRAAWTVSLTEDKSVFSAGQKVALTATTNQDVSKTNAEYWIAIIDETTGTLVGGCTSGTTCTQQAYFWTGPPHTYIAAVEHSQDYATSGTVADIQASSNTVSTSRAPWTVAVTGTTTVVPGQPTWVDFTVSATANQNYAEEDGYVVYIIDYTTGDEVYECSNPDWGCTYSHEVLASGSADVYFAEVAASPGVDVQAVSNGFSSNNGVGALGSDETVGGSNPSENAQCGCSGDPVNTETGEYYESTTDLGLAGAGPGVSVGRTYSSADASVDGPFGYGWSASFGAELTPMVTGDSSDPLPRQVQITQENGATVQFGENPDQTYSPPSRVLATLTNDPVTGDWTFTRRATQVMVFNADGQLIDLEDAKGNTVAVGYTTDGRVDSLTGSGGRSIDLTWTDDHVSEAEDSAGRIVTYNYDTSGNLISVSAVDGSIWLYGYNSGHLMTTFDTPDGGETTNSYDSSHRVTSQIDPVGRVTTFSYSGSKTTATDPSGDETVDVYSDGLLQSRTTAAGTADAETTTYSYDSSDNVASVTDPLGKVTSYTYDSSGNVLSETDPLGNTTTSTYDALGDVTSVTDPLSREATATYDSAGDKLSSTSPSGRVQHWTYNADGTIATFEDARGKTTTYGYSSAGDQTSVTDPDSRTTSTVYNSAGIVASITDPGGNVTTYTTDAAGRVLTATDPNSHTTTYTYDGDGNKTSEENSGGNTTTYVYDAADQLTSMTVPGGHTTTYTYTGAGLPATVTDPDGHESSKSYNALGLVTASTNGDGKVTHYGYDGDGRQVYSAIGG
jgi:YD repeat-containing protein